MAYIYVCVYIYEIITTIIVISISITPKNYLVHLNNPFLLFMLVPFLNSS